MGREIDLNRLVSVNVGRPGARSKYPWKTMKVGDWFVMPKEEYNARSQSFIAGRKTGRKFAVTRRSSSSSKIVRVK